MDTHYSKYGLLGVYVNTHVSGFLSAQSTETSLSTDWNMVMCRFANDGLGVDILVNGEIRLLLQVGGIGGKIQISK